MQIEILLGEITERDALIATLTAEAAERWVCVGGCAYMCLPAYVYVRACACVCVRVHVFPYVYVRVC